MKHHLTTRAIASALIFTLTYTPILGASTGTSAVAQAAQNTTYSYQYDAIGNVTQVTDPLGRVTNLAYDALGRAVQQTLPAPTASAARPVVQSAYDGQDQLLTVTDPRQLVTAYTVDGLGNRSVLASPDTGTSSNTYDLAGNLTASSDARGKTTTYAYDALNRVTRIGYASGPATVFEYDGGKAGVANAIGKLTAMTDESGNTTYAYDAFGRLISKIQTVVAGGTTRTFTVGYAYGASGTATGKPTSVTYPSGSRINYIYDDAGQLKSLTLDSAGIDVSGAGTSASITLLTGIFYAPFSGVQSWYWGNSTDAALNGYARTFDLDGRITSYTLGNVQTTGVVRHVNYDAASRIVGYTHEGVAATPAPAVLDQSFAYDDLDRLTAAQSNSTSLGFGYDANGNRTQTTIGGTSYSNVIGAGNNRLMSTTGPAPAKSNAFDATGNLVSDGTATYTYSDRGRLARAVKDGMTTDYLYNGLGQRVVKVGAAVATGSNYIVYDEQGHVLGEYAADGTALQETVYLGDTPVAVLGTVVSYVYADHLDTPRLITRSSDNAIVWRWDVADPFGVQTPQENPSGAGAFTYNLRFPGQLFDRETNNHYNYYRDYDPHSGRYIQSDPIGLGGGINTYGYVNGNPLSGTDASGLICVSGPGGRSCFTAAGPGFTLPAAKDFPSYIGPDGKNNFYHSYDVQRSLNGADAACVENEMRNNPTPGRPSPATPTGTPNNAVVLGQDNLVTSYLTHDVASRGQVVVNITGSGSLFGPGYVARYVSDGVAHTSGEGLNYKQAPALTEGAFQNIANDLLWGRQMDEFIKKCTCGR